MVKGLTKRQKLERLNEENDGKKEEAKENSNFLPNKEEKELVMVVPDIVVLQTERIYDNGAISVQITAEPVCNCKDYDGQDFFCGSHKTIAECPRCHSIKADIEITNWIYPTKNLRCRVCGIFYIRDMVTGQYTWMS